jgi:hypothetical protein
MKTVRVVEYIDLEGENHTNYDSYGTCRYDGIYCNPICKCRNKQQRS